MEYLCIYCSIVSLLTVHLNMHDVTDHYNIIDKIRKCLFHNNTTNKYIITVNIHFCIYLCNINIYLLWRDITFYHFKLHYYYYSCKCPSSYVFTLVTESLATDTTIKLNTSSRQDFAQILQNRFQMSEETFILSFVHDPITLGCMN